MSMSLHVVAILKPGNVQTKHGLLIDGLAGRSLAPGWLKHSQRHVAVGLERKVPQQSPDLAGDFEDGLGADALLANVVCAEPNRRFGAVGDIADRSTLALVKPTSLHPIHK